jgi:hypothetical protein
MSFGKRNPTGQPTPERRGAPREKADATGHIHERGKAPVRCLVEYSSTGAELQMPSIFGIGNTFELSVSGRTHHARVVRRAPRTLFVAFR